ncbi:MAG: hypothetical protein AABX85_04000 [Nanoarchaeota archaeon]
MLMVNKKGASDEGGMLIWIVVAIIAAVVVILFFTGGFSIFSGLFGQAPQSLEVAAQACKLVATPETRLSFCDQWRKVEITGETQEVNCQYPTIQSQLDLGTAIECRSKDGAVALNYTQKGEEYCVDLFKSAKVTEKTKINDVVCSSLTCAKLNGELIAKGGTCASANVKPRDKGFSEAATNGCCLKV